MQLGVAIVVFLAIGIVVMILFCLVTRYFNKKLQRALEDQNQVYSMIDEINGNNQNMEDAEYEEFVRKRQNEKQKTEKPKGALMEMEMTNVKDPLINNNDDIYGQSKLKRRLNGERIPAVPETGRSLSSLKSFRPQKLDSNRTNRSAISRSDQDGKTRSKKKKEDLTEHKFISKLVAYTENGILVLENNVSSLIKQGPNSIDEKRTIKNSKIKNNQNIFQDTLEVYGFEEGEYGAYKYETTVGIPHMKSGEQYPIKALSQLENKEEIQFADYYTLKDKLQDQI